MVNTPKDRISDILIVDCTNRILVNQSRDPNFDLICGFVSLGMTIALNISLHEILCEC